MVALCNRADRIYFHPVVCSSFFLSFFSSPNLSRCRLDVCHTSTHGVAVNLGPPATEIDPVVSGTPANFNGFASWQRYCTVSLSLIHISEPTRPY